MGTLLNKANEILSEKNTKIIPENIIEGVEIFDVTGTRCSVMKIGNEHYYSTYIVDKNPSYSAKLYAPIGYATGENLENVAYELTSVKYNFNTNKLHIDYSIDRLAGTDITTQINWNGYLVLMAYGNHNENLNIAIEPINKVIQANSSSTSGDVEILVTESRLKYVCVMYMVDNVKDSHIATDEELEEAFKTDEELEEAGE